MDLTRIIPVIRGAYISISKGPLFILHSPEVDDRLPSMDFFEVGEDEPENLASWGKAVREGLMTFVEEDGSLPVAVSMPGVGSFFAGRGYQAALAAKGGLSHDTERLFAAKPAGFGEAVCGRIALVTGGAQGFGAHISRGLADLGAFVIVADINLEGAQSFVDSLNRNGDGRAMAMQVDVSDEESVQKLLQAVVSETGGLDMLVSNAGVLRAGSVLEMSAQDFDMVCNINYQAFFLMTKHCAPIFISQHSSAPEWTSDIIQINSKSGLQGSSRNGAYAGSKFGSIGLVQSFAMELVDHGIKVNAVCPGNFFDGPLWSDPEKGLFVQYLNAGKVPGAKNTGDIKAFYEGKVPMKRGCSGDDVLKAIVYCVEQQYETGQALPVSGGQVMLK